MREVFIVPASQCEGAASTTSTICEKISFQICASRREGKRALVSACAVRAGNDLRKEPPLSPTTASVSGEA